MAKSRRTTVSISDEALKNRESDIRFEDDVGNWVFMDDIRVEPFRQRITVKCAGFDKPFEVTPLQFTQAVEATFPKGLSLERFRQKMIEGFRNMNEYTYYPLEPGPAGYFCLIAELNDITPPGPTPNGAGNTLWAKIGPDGSRGR